MITLAEQQSKAEGVAKLYSCLIGIRERLEKLDKLRLLSPVLLFRPLSAVWKQVFQLGDLELRLIKALELLSIVIDVCVCERKSFVEGDDGLADVCSLVRGHLWQRKVFCHGVRIHANIFTTTDAHACLIFVLKDI